MLIARVIGDITATQKHPSHEARKILLVQPLNLDGSDRGNPLVALDAVEAGVGDRVLVTTDGYAAFTSVGHKLAPIDVAVLGVIDQVELIDGGGVLSQNPAAGSEGRGSGSKKQHKKSRSQ